MSMMHALKAQVKGGRLILDEPTELSEGDVVYLVPLDNQEEMSDDERARLDAVLELSIAQAEGGQLVDADAVIKDLLARQ